MLQTSPQAIAQPIGSIYADQELMEEAACKEHLQARSEGARAAYNSAARLADMRTDEVDELKRIAENLPKPGKDRR